MIHSKLIAITSSILLLFAGTSHAQMMDYKVIATLNQNLYTSMSVVVDDVAYPLKSNSTYPIIFSGEAPIPKSGYRYAKTANSTGEQLLEPFLRSPQAIESTPHEFFNRTWNKHSNARIPQVYSATSPRDRVVSSLHKDDEIPTIHFIANQTALDLMHHSSEADPVTVNTTVSYVSLEDAFQFKNVELSLSGRSSNLLAKLSYILKIQKKESLFGYRRIKLRGLGFDPSYVREQMGYDILSSVGVASTEFSYVRVFMNDRELGLFGLVEAFQNPWLANEFAGGDSSYKNGYLYQGTGAPSSAGDTSDLAYYENNITAYAGGQYKVKEEANGESKDNFQPLMDFTKFIAEAPVNTSDAVTVWNKMMDTEAFLRSMAIEILGGYSDGYISNNNNFFIYQNPKTQQYIYIPHDLDFCLGNTLANVSQLSSGNYSAVLGWDQRPLIKRIMLVPEFKDRFVNILQELNEKLFNIDVVRPRIDDLANMLQEDVAWDRTLPGVAQDTFDNLKQNIPEDFKNNPIIWDATQRVLKRIPVDEAINNLDSETLTYMSLKQWFLVIHQNTATFLSQLASA
ncbi:coth protein-domain-containing protein, partial [Mucor mucedo]|uniref:coth protein-domain-containing protein n=1 Tax=Mucor mucedo TaxID=29922 RepID=UPI00221F7195